MKTNLLYLAIMLIPSLLKAQTPLPYSNNFDTPTSFTGWSFAELGNICGPAHTNHYWDARIHNGASSAPNVLYHDYEVGYEGNDLTEDWAISPNFNFENGAEVSFKLNVYSIMGTPNPEDNIELYLLKSDEEGNITQISLITSLIDYCNGVFDGFDDITINIAPTPGNSHIGFKYESINNWFTVGIDDLNISSSTANVSPIENLFDKISIYPNPAKEHITISYEGDIPFNDIQIIDLHGRTVKNILFNETVFVGDISQGIYFMKIKSKTNTVIKKIIISD